MREDWKDRKNGWEKGWDEMNKRHREEWDEREEEDWSPEMTVMDELPEDIMRTSNEWGVSEETQTALTNAVDL